MRKLLISIVTVFIVICGFKLKQNVQNKYLQGNYAPIKTEINVTDLPVIGAIPPDLSGIYMRNGPNPKYEPIYYTYPLDGDGMLHAVYIENGKASYKNKYVHTKGLQLEDKFGRALYGSVTHPVVLDPKLVGKDVAKNPFKNPANIHIIQHAGQYLALYESSIAYQMDHNLATLGEWVPHGLNAPLPVNAHTRLDPVTKDLWFFTYNTDTKPYLIFYKFSPTGHLIDIINIDKPYSTMMHDFVITDNYIVIFDAPAIFDMSKLKRGQPPLSWQPEVGMNIGIINKHNKHHPIKWIKVSDPFWVYHFANAYEQDNKIIVDYVKHDKLSFKASGKPPQLYRSVIDLYNNNIFDTKLGNQAVEFPRINDHYNSKPYRYIYMPSANRKGIFKSIIKYDLNTRQIAEHNFGNNAEIDEAVFVPRADGIAEDDGYVMMFVYKNDTNKSEFVILDAKIISAEPIARILLPQRVPHGLHGSWFGYMQ
jgi:carotenoid cleavage dioxygenase-like enzyme